VRGAATLTDLLRPANRRCQRQTQAGVFVVVNHILGSRVAGTCEARARCCRGRVAPDDPDTSFSPQGEPDRTLVRSRCAQGAASIRDALPQSACWSFAKQKCRKACNGFPRVKASLVPFFNLSQASVLST